MVNACSTPPCASGRRSRVSWRASTRPATRVRQGSFLRPAPGTPGPAVPDAPWTLLVAHDGIFKVVLLTLLDLPLDRFWTFPFALCGITVVELRDGRGILRAHNLTEHLAPLAVAA